MKIHSNPEVIKRNGTIGFWSALIGPILLAIGASLGINSGNLALSLVFLVFGFIFYQVGQGMRRFGSGAETGINESLKSLNNDYNLYHFTSPAAHLLVGPAGVWILIPRYGKGKVIYNDKRKRWKIEQKGAGRIFGNSLTRLDLEMANEATRIDRHLQKHWQLDSAPHIQAAVILMSKDVEIDANNAPVPTMHISKLRGFIKTQEKKPKNDPSVIAALIALFEPEE